MPPKPSIAAPYISTLQQQSLLLSHFLHATGGEISEMLNNKTLKVADLGFTYRQINSWDEHGLLHVNRDGTEWRSFSIMDRIWIGLIGEMRKYGISLKQIGKVKTYLTEYPVGVGNRIAVLEFYTAHAAPRKHPCVVVIFEDASALICQYQEWLRMQLADKVPNHVLIHLNPIFEQVFPKGKIGANYKEVTGFGYEDFEMLSAISTCEFEKVEVTYKDGRADILKGQKRHKVNAKLVDILRENAYQKVEVELAGGEVSRIIQWKRIKLKKA